MDQSSLAPALRHGAISGLALGTVTMMVVGACVTAVNPIEVLFSFVLGAVAGLGFTPFAFLERRLRGRRIGRGGCVVLALASYALALAVFWIAVLQAVYTQGAVYKGSIRGGLVALDEFLSTPRSPLSHVPSIEATAVFILVFAIPAAPLSVARARGNIALGLQVVIACAAAFSSNIAAALLNGGRPSVTVALVIFVLPWAVLVLVYDRSGIAERELAAWLARESSRSAES